MCVCVCVVCVCVYILLLLLLLLLYENPAKFFFCDLLFSTKTHLSYGKEHSVQIEPSYLEY